MRRRLTARRGRRPALSASALAEMGVCERRVVFEQRDGGRPSAARRQAMARGRRLHADFYWMGRLVRRWLRPGRRGKGGGGRPDA